MHDLKLPQELLKNCIVGTNTIYNDEGKPVLHQTGLPVSEIVITENIMLFNNEEVEKKPYPFWAITKDLSYSKLYLPGHYVNNPPYEGRPFIFGLFDCYTLLHDWYYREHGIVLPWNVDRPPEWWKTEQSIYLKHARKSGFVDTSTIKKGTVILSKLGSQVVNHVAVCIDEKTIIQHHYGRMSYSSELKNSYLKHSSCTMIHESLL